MPSTPNQDPKKQNQKFIPKKKDSKFSVPQPKGSGKRRRGREFGTRLWENTTPVDFLKSQGLYYSCKMGLKWEEYCIEMMKAYGMTEPNKEFYLQILSEFVYGD